MWEIELLRPAITSYLSPVDFDSKIETAYHSRMALGKGHLSFAIIFVIETTVADRRFAPTCCCQRVESFG